MSNFGIPALTLVRGDGEVREAARKERFYGYFERQVAQFPIAPLGGASVSMASLAALFYY